MKDGEVRDFGRRDKIGYMFGDFGNDFTFIFASSFLMVFYTKVLGISGGMVGTLFLVARFVDAFTDVTMGRIVDAAPPARDGKFRCWIRRMCGPVALSSFLMYQTAMAQASMPWKIVYMYVTYLLWGSIFYTSINIPYGSMASAITTEASERTALSTSRSIGATLAGLVIGIVTPLFLYTTDADGNQVVRGGGTFTVVAGIFSILALICYLVCYRMTTERVAVEREVDTESVSFAATLGAIVKSRALLGMIGAAVFLLLSQLLISTMNNYIYPDYFGGRPWHFTVHAAVHTGDSAGGSTARCACFQTIWEKGGVRGGDAVLWCCICSHVCAEITEYVAVSVARGNRISRAWLF